jgi:hypothetical protein
VFTRFFYRGAVRALRSLGDLLAGRLVNQSHLEERFMGQSEQFNQKLAGLRAAVEEVSETIDTESQELKTGHQQLVEEISSLRAQVRGLEGGEVIDFSALDELTAKLHQSTERIGGLSETLSAAGEALPALVQPEGGGTSTGGGGGSTGSGSGVDPSQPEPVVDRSSTGGGEDTGAFAADTGGEETGGGNPDVGGGTGEGEGGGGATTSGILVGSDRGSGGGGGAPGEGGGEGGGTGGTSGGGGTEQGGGGP